MKKYAFIVDPFSSGALYAEALCKRGIIPVAVISHNPILNVYKESFRESDYQYIYTYHQNEEALFKALSNLLVNTKPVLILAGAETGIELADKLSEFFCPELSNGSQLSIVRRNKYEMVEQLRKNNIPAAASIKSNDASEVLKWVKKLELLSTGVVIKPLNSAGTDGVVACFSESEIESAINNSLGKINQFNYRNETILAQEFLVGTEYVVDTASYAGKHHVTNICCYKKTTANGSKFVYDYLDFLPEKGSIQDELSEYAYQILNALGIKYGPAHSEIIYTNKGPRLVETGARLHGGVAIPACRLATGSSQLDLSLDYILNHIILTNQINYALKKFTRIVFLISHHENDVFGEHGNINNIRKLKSFTTLKLNIHPYDYLKKTIDLFSMPGLLILSHESAEQVREDYETIREFEKQGLFTFN